MATLNTTWTAASEEMYKATQAAGAQQPGAGGNSHNDGQQANAGENVTDAEFEEVK
jgi:molecular chaperone DnaK